MIWIQVEEILNKKTQATSLLADLTNDWNAIQNYYHDITEQRSQNEASSLWSEEPAKNITSKTSYWFREWFFQTFLQVSSQWLHEFHIFELELRDLIFGIEYPILRKRADFREFLIWGIDSKSWVWNWGIELTFRIRYLWSHSNFSTIWATIRILCFITLFQVSLKSFRLFFPTLILLSQG